MRKMMMAVAVMVLAVGCGTDRSALKDGKVKDVLTAQSDAETIRVIGLGVAPEGTVGDTRKKGLARGAAAANARWELAAMLRGIRLHGNVTVAMLEQKDSRIRESMDQLIAGAIEAQTEFTKDSGAVVLLEIDRDKVEAMLESMAAREKSEFNRNSLDQQVRLSDAKSRERRARLPGMSD